MLFARGSTGLTKKYLWHSVGLKLSKQQLEIHCRNAVTVVRVRKYAKNAPDNNEINPSITPRKNAVVEYFGSVLHTVKSPLAALSIGTAGLIPFAAAPAYIYYYAPTFCPCVISAQLAYGAVILSFLGGIRWGFYLPRFDGSQAHFNWTNGLKSTIPTLFATSALIIPDLTGGLLTVSFGLLLALYNDLQSETKYPKWMLGLRSLLTTGAIICLILSIILVEENRNKPNVSTKNLLIDKTIEVVEE